LNINIQYLRNIWGINERKNLTKTAILNCLFKNLKNNFCSLNYPNEEIQKFQIKCKCIKNVVFYTLNSTQARSVLRLKAKNNKESLNVKKIRMIKNNKYGLKLNLAVVLNLFSFFSFLLFM